MSDRKVEDVMTNLVVMLYPEDTVHEAADRLARNHISGAPVVERGKVIGMVSESDLIHAVLPPVKVDPGFSVLDYMSVMTTARPRRHTHGKKVSEVMSPVVISIGPDQSIWKAAVVMEQRGVKRLPVTDDDDYLVGIISRADIVKAVGRADEQIRTDVLEAIGILGEEVIPDLTVDVKDGVVTIAGQADRKSTHELAIKLAGRTPGVVEVIDLLGFEIDDHRARFPSASDVMSASTPR